MQKEDFVFFWKKNEPSGYMSNWYEAPFEVNGVRYESSEAFMMHQKAVLMGDLVVARIILQTKSQAEIKALGRKVRNFDAKLWDEKKFEIVLEGNIAKFMAHKDLADKLLATGDKILVEASPTDQIYGIGLNASDPRALDQSQWRGENLLGKVLMAVRARLRA